MLFCEDCIPIVRFLGCFIPGSCSLEVQFVSRPRVRTASVSCDASESWIRPSICSRSWSESVKSWVAAQSSSLLLGIPWDAVTRPPAWKVSDMCGNVFFAEICRIYFGSLPERRMPVRFKSVFLQDYLRNCFSCLPYCDWLSLLNWRLS